MSAARADPVNAVVANRARTNFFIFVSPKMRSDPIA
jgi:hypothetical protein